MELNHRRYEEMTVPQLKGLCDALGTGLNPFEPRRKANYIKLLREYDACADQWEADFVNPPTLPEGYHALLLDGRVLPVVFHHRMRKVEFPHWWPDNPYGRHVTEYHHDVVLSVEGSGSEFTVGKPWGPDAVENLLGWYREQARCFSFVALRKFFEPGAAIAA